SVSPLRLYYSPPLRSSDLGVPGVDVVAGVGARRLERVDRAVRCDQVDGDVTAVGVGDVDADPARVGGRAVALERDLGAHRPALRSEEHTSELQSRENLVCR